MASRGRATMSMSRCRSAGEPTRRAPTEALADALGLLEGPASSLDILARELAAVQKIPELKALAKLETMLGTIKDQAVAG